MKSKIIALPKEYTSLPKATGEGRAGILVVVSVTEHQEKMLYDLLKAIKLDAEADIKLLALAPDQQYSLSSVIKQHQIKKVVAFGYHSRDLGFNLVHAYYHSYALDGTVVIFSESIAELTADKAKKLALWQTLQKVFLTK